MCQVRYRAVFFGDLKTLEFPTTSNGVLELGLVDTKNNKHTVLHKQAKNSNCSHNTVNFELQANVTYYLALMVCYKQFCKFLNS